MIEMMFKPKFLQYTFLKYGMVGVVNTIFGYSIIFGLMLVGISPILSNFTGYFFGIILSYFLNKRYTFQSKKRHVAKEMSKFFISMFTAYIVNLFILNLCYKILYINPYISQLIAGASYVGSGYLLSKLWVFKPTETIH